MRVSFITLVIFAPTDVCFSFTSCGGDSTRSLLACLVFLRGPVPRAGAQVPRSAVAGERWRGHSRCSSVPAQKRRPAGVVVMPAARTCMLHIQYHFRYIALRARGPGGAARPSRHAVRPPPARAPLACPATMGFFASIMEFKYIKIIIMSRSYEPIPLVVIILSCALE